MPRRSLATRLPPDPRTGPHTGPHSGWNPQLDCLPVVETFHSLQGEGLHSGRSAFFIRLAGCRVGLSLIHI